MSHVTKENMTNLWLQVQSSLRDGTSNRPVKTESLSYTNLVRQLLRRLKPSVYISLQSNVQAASPQHLSTDSASSTRMSQHGSSFSTGSSSRPGSFYTTSDAQSCHGIVPVEVVVETESYFYLVQPYYQYTLNDAVTFSPTLLDTSHAKPLFIVYQLLHAMHSLHNQGLRMGDIQICDIVMDKNMWLRVSSPKLSILIRHSSGLSSPGSESGSMYMTANSPEIFRRDSFFPLDQKLNSSLVHQTLNSPTGQERMFQAACDFMKAQRYKNYEIKMLDAVVDAWMHRQINNFQYLMILNHLAGRQMNDPNNHPVLPWVLDFSAPDSGYRDLTKSKFRLNKGDGQLDFTYTGMLGVAESGEHIPHHVSDILSDITYYVYKARRTPKSILCAHVRSNWVPHEYPISMQRLQDWTPDECIPEFFTDPSIFESIHEDLPDLEIPLWCKNAVDFVVRHLAALESENVSSNLHHWIDLTFGYKLSGPAAVKAKNVHLHLVDQHTYLIPHGATQLFQQPHPQRESQQIGTAGMLPQITRGLLNSQLLTYGLPDIDKDIHGFENSESSEAGRINQAIIHLPRNYNPVAELEKCEALQEFKVKALHVPGSASPAAKQTAMPKYQDDGVTEDMVTLLCLVCEINLNSKLRMQETRPTLWKRVNLIKRVTSSDFSEIQRPLQKFVCDMFDSLDVEPDQKFIFHPIFPDGSPPPTPGFLLQPYSDLIPFPPYFTELYSCLNQIEGKMQDIEQIKRSHRPLMERSNLIKRLEREKVPILEAFLWRHQGYLGSEGMGLVLPYIQDLLQNEFSTVQAAWSLFDKATRELGPVDSTKQFLTSLTTLYSGDIASAKHIKLYHRSFLIQLIIRLGLKTFLVYFSTLLVEAVAGYKDFAVTNRFYSEELMEALNQEDVLKSSRDKTKPAAWPKVGFQHDVNSAPDEGDGEVSEAIADRISLDGSHVLLEGEPADENVQQAQGDMAERVSLDSLESDDRMAIIMGGGRGLTSEEPYGSADQHSIHSISLIMPSNREDSPNVLDDLEPFGATYDDLDMGVSESDSTSEGQANSDEKSSKSYLLQFEQSTTPTRQRSTSDMVRSETEDLMLHLSSDSSGGITNIRDIAADSVKWLCHKLGPVLATKFLSRNLVRMLALCYLGQEQLQFVEEQNVSKTSRLVAGDINAQKILECIGFTVVLYGEQVILIQCLPNIIDMISVAQKRLSPRAEGGLIASVVLLSFLIPYLSDCNLLNQLEDSILTHCINPVLSIITSPTTCFPFGALSRFVLCHKLIDLMYILGLRLGFEMTRKYLTEGMVCLFDTFSRVHGQTYIPPESQNLEQRQDHGSYGSEDSYLTIKMDLLTQQYKIGSPVDPRTLKSPPKRKLSKMHSLSSMGIIEDKDDYVDARSPSTTTEKCAQELRCVFSPELAQACYIPLCRIFGSIHMEEHLHNEDLIRQLCAQHDNQTDIYSPRGQGENKTSTPSEYHHVEDDLMTPTDDSLVCGEIGSNVAMVGNRIQLNETPASNPIQLEVGQFGRGYKHSGILAIHLDDLRSAEMEQNKSRHLRGNWLAYWERELGLHERDTMFNFMQIELQTYTGHTSSIRSLHTMDTENCFISASKDKTVRLWSINSCGDGMKREGCQFCYTRHKKSVFSVAYVESMRLVASCDSTVHVWDPYTGVSLNQLDSPKYSPVVALTALPAPSTLVVMATTEASLKFLDMRTSKYTHSFHCSIGNTGLIRCLVVSPDSNWIAVGFSSGFIYILDTNSGILMHYWKAHDGEILQLKAYSKSRLLSSAFDQMIKLWNVDTGQEVSQTKIQSEPVHCLSIYRDQLLSATTGNKVSVYSSITESVPYSVSKLKPSTFKGVLTHMSVLPLNKALLLGSDNGMIKLMA
ncbi:unnamed protein product [Lymnaea stagnalis]|uniref:BEACH domain-containing protein n=1 Tax=Lymnaea stagnalis TaxID=6523 RepID=A0AAV2HUZ7_LYMST